MKLTVESSVMRHLRLSDGVSRVELARQLDLAPSTIGIHVDRLLRNGLLREGRRAEMKAGRPPTILELNPDAGQFIGVDLDAHQVRAISIDFAQHRLSDHVEPIGSNASAAEVVRLIRGIIDKVKRKSRRLLGIGLAVPGTVDADKGLALHYKFIPGWRNVPLAETMRKRFHAPVHLENNIRSMALAERWYGLGRDVDNYVCLGIRSGIGSGLVINGELYRGPDNLAGEIGAWPTFEQPGIEQPAQQRQTLEAVASIPAILASVARLARAGQSTTVSVKRNRVKFESLVQAVRRGDSLVLNVLAGAATEVGRVIAQIHLLINPQRVIVAGPLAGLHDAFLVPLRTAVASFLPGHHGTEPVIVASQLDPFIAALGASACAAHAFQPEVFSNSPTSSNPSLLTK